MSEGMYFQNADYDELCGCVMIPMSKQELESLEYFEFTNEVDLYKKKIFNKRDRTRSYLSGCKNCDCGIKLSVRFESAAGDL